jgi:hypothetical protein
MAPAGRTLPLKLLERLGVAALLLAALLPRARGLTGPFDRDFDGFQGACFATFCVNYERLGLGRFGGYPSFHIDVPEEGFDEALYVYANHPPAVPLLCLATLKLFGPEGWSSAWREARAPLGIEPWLRLPFLAFHVLGLLAFWWALREAGGPRVALLGLALLAMTPLSIAYAQLVNYENPSLLFVFLACGFHARFLRHRPGRNLLYAGLAFAAATCVTFAPLFFIPPLVAQVWVRRGWRTALRAALAIGLLAAVPILAHGLWVRLALPTAAAETVVGRAQLLLGPLFTGELPLGEWARRQTVRILYYFTWPLALAALAGLAVALLRERGPRTPIERVELGPPLVAGGLLYLLAFYRHTFDGAGVADGQTIFLIDLAPGAAAAAAGLLDLLAAPLLRQRGGVAALVVATGLLGLPGLSRANELYRRWREPGPRDVAEGRGPPSPLPSTTGRALRALLPPGSVTFYPVSLGFNQAAAFYAWRTLAGVTRDTFGMQLGRAQLFGLGHRERYLLVPKTISPAVAAELGDVRATLAAAGAPAAEDADWEVWRLSDD